MVKKTFCKADMHAHSIYSEHPSEWILQKLGTRESYTQPEALYQRAIANGMDYVVITDHNRIEGAQYLVEKYPAKCFMGVEATVYFPEDGCKVHILIYDFTVEQFKEIDIFRKDIYKLRDFIKNANLPYSIAHATYSVNNKLTIEHLEKLIVLFDTFETINGGRNLYSNKIWNTVLSSLNPEKLNALISKHGLTPYSDTPWIKGFTGGSDDHAGILLGKTHTVISAKTKEEFLNGMRKKESMSSGRHNEFFTLSFSIYKIAWDFIQSTQSKNEKNIFSYLNELIFLNDQPVSLKKKLILKHLKSKYKKRNNATNSIIIDFITNIQKQDLEIEEKIDQLYEMITKITDQYFSSLISSLIKDIKKLDLINMFQKISSSLFGVILTLPFITTLKHMYENRGLLDQLQSRFIPDASNKSNKIIWFTDTITDLNGVSVTLKKIAELTNQNKIDLTIAGSVGEKENHDLPVNFKNLESIIDFTPNEYEHYTFRIPSIMKTLREIYELHPDMIIISTPGPVGLIGLLCAKLLNIKTKAIYHTDFTLEFEKIIGENSPSHFVEGYVKWFYEQNEKILVPTTEYISILEERGYTTKKMEVFKRGLDLNDFFPREKSVSFISNFYKLEEGINLLFTGRISKDKNLDFLCDVFERLQNTNNKYNLIITGDGPYLNELKKRTKSFKNVVYTGKVKQNFLPYLYSGADLFLFPSVTDTFGMSVLEAQACGLPCIVSTTGGPKEIIRDTVTGYSLPTQDITLWCKKIIELVELKQDDPETFNRMKSESVKNVERNYDWSKILEGIFK